MSTNPRSRYDDLVRTAAEARDEEAAAERALREVEVRLTDAQGKVGEARRAIRAYIEEDVNSLRVVPEAMIR